MVCKYCAYSIDMNSRVALIAQYIKTSKHKNLKEKETQKSGRQLSLEETAVEQKKGSKNLKLLTMTQPERCVTQLFLYIKLNQILENQCENMFLKRNRCLNTGNLEKNT